MVSAWAVIEVAWPSVMAAAHRPYIATPVCLTPDEKGYWFHLVDPASQQVVPVLWSSVDEAEANTPVKRISFVSELLRNAVRAMDDLLESGRT